MILYVNARFLSQPVSGVQRYAIECCRKIKKKYKECVLLVPPDVHNTAVAAELGAQVIGSRTGHAWEQIDLPRYLHRLGSPPLWNPCNTAPLFYNNNFITLHDLAFHYYPGWNSRAFALWYNMLVPRIVRRSRHMFTVSHTVQAEIATVYGVPTDKVSVTYNGLSEAMMAGSYGADKEKIIFAVGSFNIRKNHHRLIEAFRLAAPEGYRLVITGDKNKVFADTGIDEQALAGSHIDIRRSLTDAELVAQYQRAAVLVSVSLYEGFGIPVLEGLNHGCRILCSDIAVYRELYGDVATFCQPTDVTDIAKGIVAAIQAPAPAQGRVAALLQQYSYDAAAKVIIEQMTKRGA
jgi:glycosyltransferase involved in cell wall biosynthesis